MKYLTMQIPLILATLAAGNVPPAPVSYSGGVKSYFAQSPPIPQCEESLLDVLCHSIQLDKSELTSAAPALSTSRGIFAQSPYSTASHLQRATELIASGNATWDPRGIIRQWAGMNKGVGELQTLIGSILLARVPGLVDKELRKNGSTFTEEEAVAISSAAHDIFKNSVSLDPEHKPLEAVPEVLLGFVSSRIMGKLFEALMGPVTVSKKKTALDITFMGTQYPFGEWACDGLDYSFLYDFDPVWCSCAAIDIVGYMMTCGSGSSAAICDSAADAPPPVPMDMCVTPDGTSLNPNDTTLSFDVRLQRPYDVTTSPTAESPIYYFLYRGIQAFASYCTGDYFCGSNQTNPVNLIPGWNNVLQFTGMEDGEPLLTANAESSFPTMMVAQRMSDSTPTCDFAVILRGTASGFEWGLDISYKRNPAADGDYTYEDGFNRYISAYQGVLDTFFDELLVNGTCTCENLYIMTTGHSLGGAAGEITHLHLAERYGQCGATNDGVVFAPAHALSQEASQQLQTAGNIRSLIYEMDMVPAMPCAQDHGIPRCNPDLNLFGYGSGRDNYGPHVNVINITKDFLGGAYLSTDLLNLKISLSGLDTTKSTPGNLQAGANHVCSYACWTSTMGCQSSWMCDNDCPLFSN